MKCQCQKRDLNAAAGSTDINKMESTNEELQKKKNDIQEEPKVEVKDEERSDREQEDIARMQKGEETDEDGDLKQRDLAQSKKSGLGPMRCRLVEI